MFERDVSSPEAWFCYSEMEEAIMAVAYNQRYDGEWVDVTDKRWYACCDCGLVHRYEHTVLDGRILRRVFRDRRATADRRRTIGVKASIKALKKKR